MNPQSSAECMTHSTSGSSDEQQAYNRGFSADRQSTLRPSKASYPSHVDKKNHFNKQTDVDSSVFPDPKFQKAQVNPQFIQISGSSDHKHEFPQAKHDSSRNRRDNSHIKHDSSQTGHASSQIKHDDSQFKHDYSQPTQQLLYQPQYSSVVYPVGMQNLVSPNPQYYYYPNSQQQLSKIDYTQQKPDVIDQSQTYLPFNSAGYPDINNQLISMYNDYNPYMYYGAMALSPIPYAQNNLIEQTHNSLKPQNFIPMPAFQAPLYQPVEQYKYNPPILHIPILTSKKKSPKKQTQGGCLSILNTCDTPPEQVIGRVEKLLTCSTTNGSIKRRGKHKRSIKRYLDK